MKKLLLLSAFALIILISCNKTIESSQLPPAVLESFNQKYPNAQNVEWEIDGDNYEAEFKLNNEKMAAEFSASGMFLKEE